MKDLSSGISALNKGSKMKAINQFFIVISAIVFCHLLGSQIAIGEIFGQEYSHLTEIKDQTVCMYFKHHLNFNNRRAHLQKHQAPIECLIRLFPLVNLLRGEQPYPKKQDIYQVQYGKFHFNKLTEVCFNFEDQLSTKDFIGGIARFRMTCGSSLEDNGLLKQFQVLKHKRNNQ